jgi:hypothetical protein
MNETMRHREIEFLTYVRNNMVDPNSRSIYQQDTFTGNGSTTRFTLTKLKVRNISKITIDGNDVYQGHNYLIEYGEGNDETYIEFRVAPEDTLSIVIQYYYGPAMIYEGYQREDSELPRISIMPVGIVPEMVSIGEDGDGQGNHQIYYTAQYVCELRSRFAGQIKQLTHEFTNLVNKYRQLTPTAYRTLITHITFIQPQDFDNELRIYRTKFMVSIKWLVDFGN